MSNCETTVKPAKNMSIASYRKMKIKILDEFGIYLNDEQMNHIKELKTEIGIDNFCISLINNAIKTHI